MPEAPLRARPAALAALFVSLTLPSIGVVEKFFGPVGLALYLPGAAVLAFGAGRWLGPDPPWRPGSAALRASAAAVLGLTGLAFALLFPIATSGLLGPGSDADEAYDLGVSALAGGRNPYREVTYLGNLIHPMPGALVLSAPFVALGTSAFQGLFWLAAYFFFLVEELGLQRGLTLLVLVLGASPVVLQQLVTGADGPMSGISVLVATWILLRAFADGEAGPLRRGGSILLFVLAISNRPNFFLAVIPVLAFLARRSGAVRSLGIGAVIGSLGLALNLPFFLRDPAGYAPLEGANRLTRFAGLVPYPLVTIPALALAVTIAIAASERAGTVAGAVEGLAAGQLVFVLAGLVLSSLQAGRPSTAYAAYGCYFLFAGAFVATTWLTPAAASAPSSTRPVER